MSIKVLSLRTEIPWTRRKGVKGRSPNESNTEGVTHKDGKELNGGFGQKSVSNLLEKYGFCACLHSTSDKIEQHSAFLNVTLSL